MRRIVLVAVLAAMVGALVAAPVAVYASHQFTDVPNTNPFHDDIGWLADAGVTKGCSPTEYCPKDNVTREQMAAFMKRLAEAEVVDAGTLEGNTASDFLGSGQVLAGTVNYVATVTTGDISKASFDGDSYFLEFGGRDMSECSGVVTAGWNQSVPAPAVTAPATVLLGEPSDEEVRVRFFDSMPRETAFHIVIVCP